MRKEGLWNHVPGEINPVDIPTRMVSYFKEALVKDWFNGPEILFDPSLTFPDNESFVFPTDEIVVSSVPVSYTHLTLPTILLV